jgi:hypothetical protein
VKSKKQILESWTKDTERELVNNYYLKNIKASGRFESSITDVVTEDRTTISGAMYIGASINGRKRNINQSPEAIRKWVGWAGSTFLAEWCENKGVPVAAAFAIAYKIAMQGWTIPNSHGNDGKLLTDTMNAEHVSLLQKELSRFYQLEIKSDIQNIWQQ